MSTIAAGNMSTKSNHIANPNTMRHCGRGSGCSQYHMRRPAEPIGRALRCRWLAANAGLDFRFFHILGRYFHETRGSLNFITVAKTLRYSTSKMPWPWNRVRGPSRSLEMSPSGRPHMTSYWRSIVTMALSPVVSEILSVEKCRDLEIGVREWNHSIDCVWFHLSAV